MDKLGKVGRVAMAALIVAALAAAGCNTTRGAGQDIENAGEAVQDAAD